MALLGIEITDPSLWCESRGCRNHADFTLSLSTAQIDLCEECTKDAIRQVVEAVTILTDQTGGWLNE